MYHLYGYAHAAIRFFPMIRIQAHLASQRC